jgi:tetraacyldisaccharide 4'-kinase
MPIERRISALFQTAVDVDVRSFPWRVIRFFLSLCSIGYGIGIGVRRWAYRSGLLPKKSLPCRVISVGNVTLGGTGKTEIALAVAETLKRRNVAIVNRGYGRRSPVPVQVVSGSGFPPLSYPAASDESVLMARRLPGVPVISSADRYQGGMAAVHQFGSEWIVLDDGYQHASLTRDLDVLVLDATNPFGNRRLFPRGILREPVSSLRRAGAVVITKVSGVRPEVLGQIDRQVRIRCREGIPILRCDYVFDALVPCDGTGPRPPETLKEGKWLAFSGLGNNRFFETMLQNFGVRVAEFCPFPDHFPYDADDLAGILAKASLRGAERIVTTEKDLIRLEPLSPLPRNLFGVRVRPAFQGEGEPFSEILLSIK